MHQAVHDARARLAHADSLSVQARRLAQFGSLSKTARRAALLSTTLPSDEPTLEKWSSDGNPAVALVASAKLDFVRYEAALAREQSVFLVGVDDSQRFR